MNLVFIGCPVRPKTLPYPHSIIIMDINRKTDRSTTNLAGGHAYEWDNPKEALRSVVINNLLENTYYESDADSLTKLIERFDNAADVDPEFPLKLAAYTRQEMWVRDIPQVMLVLAAYREDTKKYVRHYASCIIDRVDELSTVLAFSNLYRNGAADDFSGSHPGQLVTALSDVIESGKFDEYQYAKYKGTNDAVSLHDVLNVARPFDDHVEWAHRVTKGYKDDHPDVEPLRQHRTWEDHISAAGEEGEITALDWRDVLDDMGLFARVRNLRNMLTAPYAYEEQITGEDIFGDVDDEWIANSKMYPFRFYQARKALKDEGLMDSYTHQFLEHAIQVSATSIPDEITNTLSVVDVSGSMRHALSRRGTITRKEISALFGAMMTANGAPSVAFAERIKWFEPDPLVTSMLRTQEDIMRANIGGSTFAHLALQSAVKRGAKWDRIVVFTDFQIWERAQFGNDPNALRNAWDEYRSQHSEEPRLYIVDLASYGEIKLPEDYPGVYRLQGWNANVLDYIWHNENSMIEDIDGVTC